MVSARPDNVNQDLLASIPAQSKVVVDVNCGTGDLGAHFRQINPLCYYIGMQCDRNSAEIAATKINRVYHTDPELLDERKVDFQGKVDCLIYGGVFEYCRDPWSLLARQSKWLSPDGQVLAYIPNVQHWSTLVHMLRGTWNYQEPGTFDRRNLRFFTRETIAELFHQAGLQINEIVPRELPFSNADTMLELAKPLLAALAIDPNEFAHQTKTIQYLVRATRPRPIRKIWIRALTDDTVCERVRIREPNFLCRTIPGVRTFPSVQFPNFSEDPPINDRVFLWQRRLISPELPESVELQKRLISTGYLTVAEFDDDPTDFKDVRQSDYLVFRACHAIQTSTEKLASIFRQFNPNVKVFENQQFSLPEFRPPKANQPGEPVRLFYGYQNRQPDWAPYIDELNRVLDASGSRVFVHVMHDRELYDSLRTPHKDFQPWSLYYAFLDKLRRCDITFLPLRAVPFNECKSDLSFLTCAANSVAVLASPVVYSNSVRDGETGLLFQSPAEFAHKLQAMIDNAPLRGHLIQNAYQWVRDHRMLCQHYAKRVQWYFQLLDRLPALTSGILERVPEWRGAASNAR